MGQEPTVFVVDDDPAIRSTLKLLCESIKIPVSTFASAQVFLDTCDADARGCIILDIRMPGVNGMALLQKLREAELTLPVLILTSYGTVELAVRAMKAGAVNFLEKPVNDQVLLDHIQQAF